MRMEILVTYTKVSQKSISPTKSSSIGTKKDPSTKSKHAKEKKIRLIKPKRSNIIVQKSFMRMEMLVTYTKVSQKSTSPTKTRLIETKKDPSTKSKHEYFLEFHIVKTPPDDPQVGKVAYFLFLLVHTNLMSHSSLFVS